MRDEHHQQIESTLHKVSKAVIIAPIVLLLIAFAIKTRDKDPRYSQNTPTPVVTQAAAQVQPSRAAAKDPNAVKLNLQGPLVCNHKGPDSTTDVYIKNRRIFAQIINTDSTDQLLIRDDCLYSWKVGETEGVKTCGLGTYLTLFDTMSSFGMLDLDQMVNSLSEFRGSVPNVTVPPASSITNSCKEQAILDTQFSIPTNVRFTEAPLEEQAP